MSDENVVVRYLKDTYEIRNVLEKFNPLDPDEDGVMVSTLAPWSLDSISINTGLDHGRIMEIIGTSSGLSLKREDPDLDLVVESSSGTFSPPASEGSPSITTDHSISVSRAMNLHILQFISEQARENKHPVKFEDALFNLKNSVFLPDDFMPEHLMGNVEGELGLNLEQVREELQIVPHYNSIYVFPEKKQRGYGRIRYLYPSWSQIPKRVLSNEKLTEIIRKSFEVMQAENNSYRDFENGRLIKSVIFNMEQKKTRELKRPVFDPRKVGILESMGLVDRITEVPQIKEEVSVGKLYELYSDSKEKGHTLSRTWLKSTVELRE